MCSVGDDIDESGEVKFMPIKQKVNLLGSKCNKCREQTPCILLRGKDVYCRQCFISGTTHKFKSLLGKHRLINPNEKVLILHEPGHASAALLSFLRTGLDLDTPKKLRFKPVFLFIDKFASLNVARRIELKQKVLRQIEGFNFSVYFISLYAFLRQAQNISELLALDPNNCEARETDLEDLKDKIELKLSETNKNEILNIFLNELLIKAAKELECKFVFTAQLSIDIASQLLTNISLGRGLHIPFDTGFCDSRDSVIKILRPLRVFEAKELAFYNTYNKVETVNIPFSENNPFSSVQSLMKKFVNELQINYPATIATVVRTGDKLNAVSNQKCSLCKAPIEISTNELTAKQATEVSRRISTQNEGGIANNVHEKLLNGYVNVESRQYCYSCSKIVLCIKM